MKKIKYILALILVAMCLSIVNVFAYFGKIDDERVEYIYWSQGNHSKMFWTGVKNKINYDTYKPCVGPSGSEFRCGAKAKKSEYQEYGLWINNSKNGGVVGHGLQTSYGGDLEYQVEMQASPSDY